MGQFERHLDIWVRAPIDLSYPVILGGPSKDNAANQSHKYIQDPVALMFTFHLPI